MFSSVYNLYSRNEKEYQESKSMTADLEIALLIGNFSMLNELRITIFDKPLVIMTNKHMKHQTQ